MRTLVKFTPKTVKTSIRGPGLNVGQDKCMRQHLEHLHLVDPQESGDQGHYREPQYINLCSSQDPDSFYYLPILVPATYIISFYVIIYRIILYSGNCKAKVRSVLSDYTSMYCTILLDHSP